MGYDILLFDADQTLFDFDRSERESIERLFAEFGLPFSDAIYAEYHAVNHSLWKALERGETTREALVTERFRILSERYGFSCNADAMNARYLTLLGGCSYLLDGAEALCRRLHGKKRLYLITNGVDSVQRSRYQASPLRDCFDDVFVSGAIGSNKPEKAFFDYVAAHIDGFDPRRALVIGDSLSSDMRGGNNAGIDCCWFNPERKRNDAGVQIRYEIASLDQLDAIVCGAGEGVR